MCHNIVTQDVKQVLEKLAHNVSDQSWTLKCRNGSFTLEIKWISLPAITKQRPVLTCSKSPALDAPISLTVPVSTRSATKTKRKSPSKIRRDRERFEQWKKRRHQSQTTSNNLSTSGTHSTGQSSGIPICTRTRVNSGSENTVNVDNSVNVLTDVSQNSVTSSLQNSVKSDDCSDPIHVSVSKVHPSLIPAITFEAISPPAHKSPAVPIICALPIDNIVRRRHKTEVRDSGEGACQRYCEKWTAPVKSNVNSMWKMVNSMKCTPKPDTKRAFRF